MVSENSKLESNPPQKSSGNRKRDRGRRNTKKGSRPKGPAQAAPSTVAASPVKNSLLPDQTKRVFHSNLPQLPVKKVQEPLEVCPICNKTIENIAEAFTSESGGHSHFDCVLKKIAESETLAENQKVSYIGRGTFAVVEPKEGGGFTFVKRIVWENQETFDAMKKYVEAAKK
ncbi:hypothetical protein SpiGrapes_0494 [Sphaerochaeta pleomorpha str. Grapes]|uniref:Uncharacterized protein n=1 Tax=Sphaerochaeta pleomorpha (strain ATCC BAA-1885 / DSM 22778 / Grapes) TaxID=158190 RepID=G8QWQ5_SPHPG|nr:hypothetical protein [Sphaerochaeta pleomorpha]AEV28349.1 hypothetical protein SpiGrapes_0494 [Sphaerochaeta pleomorpha str. Grapes]